MPRSVRSGWFVCRGLSRRQTVFPSTRPCTACRAEGSRRSVGLGARSGRGTPFSLRDSVGARRCAGVFRGATVCAVEVLGPSRSIVPPDRALPATSKILAEGHGLPGRQVLVVSQDGGSPVRPWHPVCPSRAWPMAFRGATVCAVEELGPSRSILPPDRVPPATSKTLGGLKGTACRADRFSLFRRLVGARSGRGTPILSRLRLGN